MEHNQIIDPMTQDTVPSLLQELYLIRDKNSPLKYMTVSPALHEEINKHLFGENKYKVRIEELAGFKYSVSYNRKDNEVPQYALSPLDIAKITVVYTDYDGNQITIDDLFSNKRKQWQKPVKEEQKA